jgi:hypothetical protein
MNVLSKLTTLPPGDRGEPTPDGDIEDPPANGADNTNHERMHATRVSPSGVRLETDTVRTGDRWVKVLFVTGFPETATPGLLDRICTHPSADVDVTIYAEPEDPRTSLMRFESAIKSLKVDHIAAQDRCSAKATVTARRIRDHEAVYTQLHENVISSNTYDTSGRDPAQMTPNLLLSDVRQFFGKLQ